MAQSQLSVINSRFKIGTVSFSTKFQNTIQKYLPSVR